MPSIVPPEKNTEKKCAVLKTCHRKQCKQSMKQREKITLSGKDMKARVHCKHISRTTFEGGLVGSELLRVIALRSRISYSVIY